MVRSVASSPSQTLALVLQGDQRRTVLDCCIKPNLSLSSKQLKMESRRILQIKKYLTKGIYQKVVKKSETRKRNFRRDCKEFLVKDGILFHRVKDKDLRLVSENEKTDIHAQVHGGHLGINKTWQKLRSRYYWAGSFNDVKKYVMKCDTCQRKEHLKKAKKPLRPIAVSDKAFSQIGMDLIGSLEETKTAKHASTQMDPLSVVHGRQAILPVELDLPVTDSSSTQVEDEDLAIKRRAEAFLTVREARKRAKRRIYEAQKKQKRLEKSNGGRLKKYRSPDSKSKEEESLSDTDDTILYYKDEETQDHFKEDEQPNQDCSNNVSDKEKNLAMQDSFNVLKDD
ncbi:uncharacterized protein LOC133198400 [Saccostrea echinata]|uniref:uncharacterized protein LOC133198400 n=1 Tax=Saccostrea echinata TaxID=191078 RepID=UPI002A7F166E|nr:uncharacterized protein LOC133198400 [Saccostrea echinata]